MTNPDSVLKSRDIILPTKVCSQSYGFSRSHVWKSWTIKKAEWRRIDAFKLWCRRRLLRVPWTARKSNQSIQRKSTLNIHWKGLMLELKLQSFGHLMQKANSLEKTLMLGKIEGRRRREWQRMRWLESPTQWTWTWANSGRWWRTGKPDVLQSMGSQRVRQDLATEQQ